MKYALCALLAFSTNAVAANWWKATEGANYYVFVDLSSIARAGNFRKAWTLWDFQKEQFTNDYPAKSFFSSKQLMYFDCPKKRMGMTQSVLYSQAEGSGESVKTRSISFSPSILTEVVPDTVGEHLLSAVCAFPLNRTK